MSLTTTVTGRLTRPAALEPTPTADWRDNAACREVDPELFFPNAHTRGSKTQTRDAKRVCARCPSQEACLEWAVATGQRAGVWGGLSEKERAGMYATAESQAERCWDNQVWIEQQLAKSVPQRDIARELSVTRSVLCRVIKAFQSENTSMAEGVKAA